MINQLTINETLNPQRDIRYSEFDNERDKTNKMLINQDRKDMESDQEILKQQLADIPYAIHLPERQNTDNSCGTMSLYTVFKSFGIDSDVDDLNAEINKTPHIGTLPTEILALCEKQGLQCHWYTDLPLEEITTELINDSYLKNQKAFFGEKRKLMRPQVEQYLDSIHKPISMDHIVEMMKEGKRIIVCNGYHYMTLCRAEGDNIVYMNPREHPDYQSKTQKELENRIKNPEAGGYFNVMAISGTKDASFDFNGTSTPPPKTSTPPSSNQTLDCETSR